MVAESHLAVVNSFVLISPVALSPYGLGIVVFSERTGSHRVFSHAGVGDDMPAPRKAGELDLGDRCFS